MIKYFINYEDLIENEKLKKELNIFSPELFIIRKNKKGEYNIQPLLHFVDIENELSKFIIPLNYDKKGIIMVELSKDELDKIDPLLIKRFELLDNGLYKKVNNEEEIVNLINYNSIISMNAQESDFGNIVSVMPCKSDETKLYISADRSKLYNGNIANDRRNILKRKEIGCDLYFHTENDELIEKFSDEVTKLKRVSPDKYELYSHKVFVIDSISQDRVYDFPFTTRRCFYSLCNELSTPVSISRDDDKYYLSIKNIDKREKKGYIINNPNFKNILYDSAIEPLLNYINVFELANGVYKMTPLSEYIEKTSTIKLNKNKKPSYNN